MANIQGANTGNEIRLKKKSPNRAMANASATIIDKTRDGLTRLTAKKNYMT